MTELVNLELDEDRRIVTMTFPTTPPTAFTFDLQGIESLLNELGQVRRSMIPEVPLTFPGGQSVPAIADPTWTTAADPLHGCVFLHLRDPRFGWIRNIIPREDARRLAASIQKDTEISPWIPE